MFHLDQQSENVTHVLYFYDEFTVVRTPNADFPYVLFLTELLDLTPTPYITPMMSESRSRLYCLDRVSYRTFEDVIRVIKHIPGAILFHQEDIGFCVVNIQPTSLSYEPSNN